MVQHRAKLTMADQYKVI